MQHYDELSQALYLINWLTEKQLIQVKPVGSIIHYESME